jgi:hypothetical protein
MYYHLEPNLHALNVIPHISEKLKYVNNAFSADELRFTNWRHSMINFFFVLPDDRSDVSIRNIFNKNEPLEEIHHLHKPSHWTHPCFWKSLAFAVHYEKQSNASHPASKHKDSRRLQWWCVINSSKHDRSQSTTYFHLETARHQIRACSTWDQKQWAGIASEPITGI